MIYSIFPSRDATVYENTASANTGVDEILELTKVVSSSNQPGIFNTRILIDFDTTAVSKSIASGEISGSDGEDPKFFLKLFNISQEQVPSEYKVSISPISESWSMGIGRSTHSPLTLEGVSWNFRDGKTPGTLWSESGCTVVTESGFVVTQSFTNTSGDINVDVSGLITSSFSGKPLNYQNNGLLIQRSGSQETNGIRYGSLKYFSAETHTIYSPRLEIRWDDSNFITGSLSPLESDNITVKATNLRYEYKENSKIRVRLLGCELYPTKSYSTSAYNSKQYNFLKSSSYYSVEDVASGEVIVPFDTNYTKISCDSTGNYFDLWSHPLLPERVYSINIRLDNRQYNNQQEFYKCDSLFRIVR